MKIRVTATESEAINFVNKLNNYFEVISVSRFYPNDRKCLFSNEGRLYVELLPDIKKVKNNKKN